MNFNFIATFEKNLFAPSGIIYKKRSRRQTTGFEFLRMLYIYMFTYIATDDRNLTCVRDQRDSATDSMKANETIIFDPLAINH